MTPKSIPIICRACAVDAFGPCSGVAFARATVRMVFFGWFPCKTARAPAAPPNAGFPVALLETRL